VRRRTRFRRTAGITDGIAAERALLATFAAGPTTSSTPPRLNVHQLRERIDEAFSGGMDPTMSITVVSFGYKYGLPVDAIWWSTAGFLPTRTGSPELRDYTGLDPEVRKYVMSPAGGV